LSLALDESPLDVDELELDDDDELDELLLDEELDELVRCLGGRPPDPGRPRVGGLEEVPQKAELLPVELGSASLFKLA
jgi:hypothetical protein